MNIPEKEWRTSAAFRLQQAEVASGHAARPRRALAGFCVSLPLGVLAVVLLFLSGCASPARDGAVAHYRAAPPFVSTPLPTGSMQPILVAGQQIRHWWELFAAIQVGDLVGRMDPWGGQVIIHRVIRNEGTAEMPRWVTKGDHNQRPDAGYLFEDAYVGKWAPITPVGIVAMRTSK